MEGQRPVVVAALFASQYPCLIEIMETDIAVFIEYQNSPAGCCWQLQIKLEIMLCNSMDKLAWTITSMMHVGKQLIRFLQSISDRYGGKGGLSNWLILTRTAGTLGVYGCSLWLAYSSSVLFYSLQNIPYLMTAFYELDSVSFQQYLSLKYFCTFIHLNQYSLWYLPLQMNGTERYVSSFVNNKIIFNLLSKGIIVGFSLASTPNI